MLEAHTHALSRLGSVGEGHLLYKREDLTLGPNTHIKIGRGFAHVNYEHGWEEGGARRIAKVVGSYVFLRTLSLDR